MSTYSSRGGDADWRAVDVDLTAGGASFTVVGPDVELRTEIHVPGEFNVSNALAAIASAALAGLDPRQVAAGIARIHGIRRSRAGGRPGRDAPFDVALTGVTAGPGDGTCARYAAAGVTWWLEHLSEQRAPFGWLLARVEAGPPGRRG